MVDSDTNDTEPVAETPEAPEDEGRTFTQDEVNEIMAKERAREKKRLDEAESRHQKELKRAGLDAEARTKAEKEDEMEELKARAEAAERAVRVAKAETELSKSGLPTDLAEMVLGGSDEDMDRNLRALKKAVKEAADRQYAERVAKGSPRAPEQSTDADWKKAYREAARLDRRRRLRYGRHLYGKRRGQLPCREG